MNFQASDYVIWGAFIFLETINIRSARKPEHRGIRNLMSLCLLRDFILLAWSCHDKYYWNISWIGIEAELISMALLAGSMIGQTRAWRVPAFTVSALCLHYAITEKWPIYATPEQMFHLERNCSLIVLGALLVGSVFTFERNQLRLAGAVGILAASNAVSAQSFLMGNYSPITASLVWILGLVALSSGLKGCQQLPCISRLHTPDEEKDRAKAHTAESTLLPEALKRWELIDMPCRTQVQ